MSHQTCSERRCNPNRARSLGHLGFPVLDDAQLDAVTLWQRDPSLGAFADWHDVREPCGKHMAHCILDMDHFERPRVALTMLDGANTANVVPSTDHRHVSSLELDVVQDFVGCQVKADSVVGLHVRIWIAKSSAVMRPGIGNAPWSPLNLPHAAELVARLLLLDLVQGEAALRVVQKAEILLCLINGNDILVASGIEHVRPHL